MADFVSNVYCPYFPCHDGIDKDQFSCLFCYCPLYVLGTDCGGTPLVMPNGIKDCSQCIRPHLRENYVDIIKETHKVRDLMKKLYDW